RYHRARNQRWNVFLLLDAAHLGLRRLTASSNIGALAVISLTWACSAESTGPGSETTGSDTTVDPDQTTSASSGTTDGATGGNGGVDVTCTDQATYVGRAPIRRLTRFEFNKTVEALLGDTTSPGNSLPPELVGNGFGNDADEQPISSFLAEQYGIIAGQVATRALASAEFKARYIPCYDNVNEGNEAACSRS